MKLEDECTIVELMPSFRRLQYVREIYAPRDKQCAQTPTSLDWPRYIVVAYSQCNDGKQVGVGRIWFVHNDSTDGVRLDPLPDDRNSRLVVPSSIAAARESTAYDPTALHRQRSSYINARARWDLLEGRKEHARAIQAERRAAQTNGPPREQKWWQKMFKR
jgi:hypothetical protein